MANHSASFMAADFPYGRQPPGNNFGAVGDADQKPVATQHQLSWRKKVYEFVSAPVTRFYLHVVSGNRAV